MKRFHYTAIVRKKPSLPVQWLVKNNLIKGKALDFGCGRGTDADFINAEKYDPYGFSNYPQEKFDTIICIYVLNIVNGETRHRIIKEIRDLLNPNGNAFLTVRRDKQCKKYQYWVELDLPIIYEAKGKFCIYILQEEVC